MQSIDQFLEERGLDPRHVDSTVEMVDLRQYLKDYATMVREEQIKYCAIGSAHYTALNVRNVPERLDSDLKNHMNVCRVDIELC